MGMLSHWNEDDSDYRSELETQLATSCDLVNTWCREAGVEGCRNPYRGLNLRDTVYRLWRQVSQKRHDEITKLRGQLETAERCMGLVDDLLGWVGEDRGRVDRINELLEIEDKYKRLCE